MNGEPRRSLSAPVTALLHEGATCSCHGDRHVQRPSRPNAGECCRRCKSRCSRSDYSVFAGVLLGMVNAGWDEREAWVHLVKSGNLGGRLLQAKAARNEPAARNYLHSEWNRQRQFAAENPLRDRQASALLLSRIEAALEDGSPGLRRGSAGVTDRLVLRALLSRARSRETPVACASVRQLEEETGVGKNTVVKSLRRLEAAGYVQPLLRRGRRTGGCYALQLPRSEGGTGTTEGTGEGFPVPLLPPASSALFGRGALPRGARETLLAIPEYRLRVGCGHLVLTRPTSGGPVPGNAPNRPGTWPGAVVDDLPEVLRKTRQTVASHLRKAEGLGLVVKDAHGAYFARRVVDEQAFYDQIGLVDMREARRAINEAEREAYAARDGARAAAVAKVRRARQERGR